MKITINPMSPSSVANAYECIEKYIAKVKRLEAELPRVLAEYGATVAKANFASAPYDILLSGSWSNANINVTAEQTDNGWRVLASGREVCFVEFGAGVWYNGGGETYLGTRPNGVVGIGEYGSGHGKQNVWVFGTGEDKTFTQGTPASNAMYYTAEELKRRIVDEARRILNDD